MHACVLCNHIYLFPPSSSAIICFRSFGSIILTQIHRSWSLCLPSDDAWSGDFWEWNLQCFMLTKWWLENPENVKHVLQSSDRGIGVSEMPSELERCKFYALNLCELILWPRIIEAKCCKYEVQIVPKLVWINISIPLSRLIPHVSFRTWPNCGF